MNIKSAKRMFSDFNQIEVEVGTTGRKGGDAGAGGETYVVVSDEGGTAWNLEATSHRGDVTQIEELRSVRLIVRGDSELETLAESLLWAGKTILDLANDRLPDS